MSYPTDIPALRAALGALDTGDLPVIVAGEGVTEEQAAKQTAAIVAAIQEAQATASPVPACGLALDALKDHAGALELAAASVLAGAAHLILTNNWLGRAEEADGIRDAARARIAALEA